MAGSYFSLSRALRRARRMHGAGHYGEAEPQLLTDGQITHPIAGRDMPNFLAVPAWTSSTKRAEPPDEMRRSDSGSAFCSIRRMRPSLSMKIISSGINVSFIHSRIF